MRHHPLALLALFCALTAWSVLHAETDNAPKENATETRSARELRRENQLKDKKAPRKYFTDDSPRVDAGVFHVGFAAGGNFYIEPKVTVGAHALTGDYYKDFGFQGGVYFDHDYSELDENIPLALRGMVGYKYILNSVHVFTFDGVVRRMFRFSEKASFGIGAGGSAAVWYRTLTSDSPEEETLFRASFIVGAGFEFNPFMVDFKWLVTRIAADDNVMGVEMYFGFRL